MKRIYSILFFLCCVVFIANGQELVAENGKIKVTGILLDASNNQPLPFANLGLLGTVAGVASDIDGKFELVVPISYATYVVKISAIGYAPMEAKVYELQNRPDLKLKLKPISYGLSTVDVYGELLVYKKALQDVVASINKNYISRPYSYDGYFKQITRVGNKSKQKEAVVTVYDSKGYVRDDVESAFTAINYKFNQVKDSVEEISMADGFAYMDDIMTADIVRNTRNVLDINNSRDYKLKSKGKTIYDGDSVQIIGYTALKPTISTTGFNSVVTYTGELYINIKDNAVLRNVTKITAKNFDILGRNLIIPNSSNQSNVAMTITTNYKKVRSEYFMSSTNIKYGYIQGGQDYSGHLEFITTRLNTSSPAKVRGRVYYDNQEENKEFWARYSVYFE